MAKKDINKKPYDEATKRKLAIFEQYLTAWLPVFIKSASFKKIMICDFFAGSGQDSEGVAGSPLRIFQTLEKFREQISTGQISIQVVLNEFDPKKINKLKSTVESEFDPHDKVNISYRNEDFQDLFPSLYPQLKQQPNLIFIDQYGIKHVTGATFQKLISLDQTDFFFFLSSSFYKRFWERPEFKEYLPDVASSTIAEAKQGNMHRLMLDCYRATIPAGNKTKLYPYTLKKGSNIYGLIFGSEHLLGVDKFLKIAWKESELNGEANFDIDDDITKERDKEQQLLPGFAHEPTKLDVFESRLEKFIRDKKIVRNREVYLFTLEQGHLGSHAKKCVLRLKKEEKVDCPGNIGVSYDSCIKGDPELKIIKAKTHG